jgi:5'-nucleotidase
VEIDGMRRSVTTWALALALAILSPAAIGVQAQQPDPPTNPRVRAPLTILQINDVYSTVPVDGRGGLARVATIKKQLAAAGRMPLLMIGGDFLSSSVASTVFKGEQMIAALNAAGLDVATLGNHEFDFGVDLLITRMHEAKWQWVVANVIDRQTNAIVGGAAPYVIRQAGPLKVGIIGLCLSGESMATPVLRQRLQLVDPLEAVAQYLPEMKRAGADVIIALTHLDFATDRAIAERFPDIDVIVGGHEHFPITAVAGRTLISKAGTEAEFVARIDVDKRSGNPADRYYELIPVISAIKEDPEAAAIIDSWETRLAREMDVPVGTTRVPLNGLERTIRTSETNLGDLVADAMRREVQADAALVNSGGIRGNREYPAGIVTRRTLTQIHPFTNVVCKIEVSGQVLLDALNHGVARLPIAAGEFPQVSGMRFRLVASAPPGQRVRALTIGGAPVDLSKRYTLAVPDYVLHGGDGYEMFANSRVLVSPEDAAQIVTALEHVVSEGEIAPTTDARITVEK